MKIKLFFIILFCLCSLILVSCNNGDKETVLISDDVTDEQVINRFEEALYNLPDWLLSDFEEHGWTIELCNELSEQYGKDIDGLTVYGDKSIYINSSLFSTSKRVMCHEFGHYLDCVIGDWPSKTDRFIGIFNSEFPSFYENVNGFEDIGEDSSEYWAECCFYYFALPDKLKKNCPDTYEYLNNVITTYSGIENNEPIAYN